MAHLAEVLGVSQNTIYWYFGNKDQVLMAVVEARLTAAVHDYAALPDSSIGVRLRWIFQWTQDVGVLINIVHGRLPVSEPIRQWHDALHRRVLRFFVERLKSRGVSEAQAEVLVHTAVFAFEGVLTHSISSDAAAQVMVFLESAIESVILTGSAAPSVAPSRSSPTQSVT